MSNFNGRIAITVEKGNEDYGVIKSVREEPLAQVIGALSKFILTNGLLTSDEAEMAWKDTCDFELCRRTKRGEKEKYTYLKTYDTENGKIIVEMEFNEV